jgi:hypothetical protein
VLYFQAGKGEGSYRLARLASDGSSRVLTRYGSYDPGFLEVAPGGNMVLLRSQDWETFWILSTVDNSLLRVPAPKGCEFLYAQWSPSGTAIACAVVVKNEDPRGKVSPSRLFLLHPRTNSSHELCEGSHPSWAPSGDAIAFVSESGIEEIRADGSGRRLLIKHVKPLEHGEADVATMQSWSPDGRHIAFVRLRLHVDGADELCVMDVSTRSVKVAGPAGLAELAWSPNGRYLAYDDTPSAIPTLRVFDVCSGEPVRLPQSGQTLLAMSWSLAGNALLVGRLDLSSDATKVACIDFPSGKETALAVSYGMATAKWLQ